MNHAAHQGATRQFHNESELDSGRIVGYPEVIQNRLARLGVFCNAFAFDVGIRIAECRCSTRTLPQAVLRRIGRSSRELSISAILYL